MYQMFLIKLSMQYHLIHVRKIHVDNISIQNKSNKRKMLEDAETPRLKRSEKENTAKDLFTDVCYFCKIKRKKVKYQISYYHKLTLRQVAEKIQEVPELKEDYDVL